MGRYSGITELQGAVGKERHIEERSDSLLCPRLDGRVARPKP